MRGDRKVRLLLPPRMLTPAAPARKARVGAAPELDALDTTALTLFEALRRHRLEISRAQRVPPYVVATDRALRDIATIRPLTEHELGEAHGIGPAKIERYGAGLLDVVRAHLDSGAADNKIRN
jgi:ATP-dependent DNA helicase RecQ